MARLERPDGVELHWDQRGEGPLVVLAPYWSGHPGVYEALLADLARDHRVVTWDARGTGESTRTGPYDMETDCSDLEAIVD
jgi:pimeloyl-ACP methyl ester carboxylesterase